MRNPMAFLRLLSTTAGWKCCRCSRLSQGSCDWADDAPCSAPAQISMLPWKVLGEGERLPNLRSCFVTAIAWVELSYNEGEPTVTVQSEAEVPLQEYGKSWGCSHTFVCLWVSPGSVLVFTPKPAVPWLWLPGESCRQGMQGQLWDQAGSARGCCCRTGWWAPTSSPGAQGGLIALCGTRQHLRPVLRHGVSCLAQGEGE